MEMMVEMISSGSWAPYPELPAGFGSGPARKSNIFLEACKDTIGHMKLFIQAQLAINEYQKTCLANSGNLILRFCVTRM
jgi:hypothetical protein